jgi:hypothetical protein
MVNLPSRTIVDAPNSSFRAIFFDINLTNLKTAVTNGLETRERSIDSLFGSESLSSLSYS